MSKKLIGNTEYNSIKEKAYINGTQEIIIRLAAELDKTGMPFIPCLTIWDLTAARYLIRQWVSETFSG